MRLTSALLKTSRVPFSLLLKIDAWVKIIALCCFAIAVILFAVRVKHGLWFLHFSDEAEHLLGGEALVNGYILYRTYIDAHGPVIFMATQLYAALFGWNEMNNARLISSFAAVCACAAVMASSVLPNIFARVWAGTLFLGILASVWLVQGFYLVSYHPLGGSLLVIALAQFTMCAWCGTSVTPQAALLSGTCLAFACFTAYSLAPTAALLALSGIWGLRLARPLEWSRVVMFLFLGMFVGGLLVAVWLAEFGDFVGYIVFHIITQQVNYSRYISFSLYKFLLSLVPYFSPKELVQTIALTCCMVGALGAENIGTPRRLLPVTLGFFGILLLSVRGTTNFQNGEFFIVSVATAAFAVARAPFRRAILPTPAMVIGWTIMVGTGVASAEATARQALSSPGDLTRAQIVALPPDRIGLSNDALSVKIRSLLPQEGRMLALVYAPDVYLKAGRLPINKYYEYLPWEADYAQSPWFGRDRDLCVDLMKSKPSLIYFDNWKVWDSILPEKFIPCIKDVFALYYDNPSESSNLYVKKPKPVSP